jgi:hypothetical protein
VAYYNVGQFLTYERGAEFDVVFQPEQAAPFSGVYRCAACGLSITSLHGQPLPSHDHHQHSDTIPIRWQLVVRSYFK